MNANDTSELMFSLSRHIPTLCSTVTVEAASDSMIYLFYTPKKCEQDQIQGDSFEKSVKISIHCRLVKDFQQTVIIKAFCKEPHLLVNPKRLLFDSVKQNNILKLENNSSHSLSLELKYHGSMFSVPESILLKPHSFETISIFLKNVSKVDNYCQELVTVYNVSRPTERYFIRLDVSLGSCDQFIVKWI